MTQTLYNLSCFDTMNPSGFLKHNRGNIFIQLLIFVALIAATVYFVSTNPEYKNFSKKHARDISKWKLYIRDAKKDVAGFWDNSIGKLLTKKSPKAAQKKSDEPRTFEDLLYDQAILNRELPLEILRHQQDEVTLCSFDGDYLLNGKLTEDEMIHLTNVLRFCDISAFKNMRSAAFLSQAVANLKKLRYDAMLDKSPYPAGKKFFYAFIYRQDRVQEIQQGKLSSDNDAPWLSQPFYASFKAGQWDFTLVNILSPVAKQPSEHEVSQQLQHITEVIQNQNLSERDTIILGDFKFVPLGMTWDDNSLLPGMGNVIKTSDNTPPSLCGNFWFRKKDTREFKGHSGVLQLNLDFFPASKASALSPLATPPVWGQFKIMLPDDD